MLGMIEPRETMPLLSRAAAGETLELGQAHTTARFAPHEFVQRYPEHSVEVRVPFTGAVQAGRGPARRRGTPPSIAEMEVGVFLSLVTGSMTWDDAERSGKATASGAWADLDPCPLLLADAMLGRWVE